MDATELKALLEATARELSSVFSHLPDGACGGAVANVSNEISEARTAIEQAAAACDHHEHASIIGTGGWTPSEVVGEAHSLRAEAMRARDVAETRLWTLQDEHTDLLERLRDLSLKQRRRFEEHRAEAELAAVQEDALVERCGQLDNEVRVLRKEVDAKSQRLIASTALGHALGVQKRKLHRQHEGSLVENAVAREILALQQGTEAYLQHVGIECSRVDQSLETSENLFAEKLEGLQSEWSDQHAKYQTDMASVQTRLVNLQHEYEDRWRSTDKGARQVIETRAQQASEARQQVQQELLMLDEEWEKEAVATKQLAEEQNRIMSDARQAALFEMDVRVQERQQDMEEQVAAERKRCEALRNQHLRRSAHGQTEVLRYKKCIEDLSMGYRRKSQRSTPTPRGFAMSTGSGRGSPSLMQSGQLLIRD